jgi:hypothetical protein
MPEVRPAAHQSKSTRCNTWISGRLSAKAQKGPFTESIGMAQIKLQQRSVLLRSRHQRYEPIITDITVRKRDVYNVWQRVVPKTWLCYRDLRPKRTWWSASSAASSRSYQPCRKAPAARPGERPRGREPFACCESVQCCFLSIFRINGID